ncbi:zinc finger protein [Cinnamomum micranthum f. kanehirae]|uniref:Zinc finger protein n=1 Tax=Cinnamomum micranthum f. kanehirae TaxID=337451 RepID=A0A443NB75_9MAGN|nr:zinc finger protein [Cinnamomum micranthum f. kanehirae]
MSGHVDLESLRPPYSSSSNQKCSYCGRLLRQKSPWSSYRIVNSGDMPVGGVLSCSHVFHAECSEQTTPKTQILDPPCPLCLKIAVEAEATSAVPEPIQIALGSVCGNQGGIDIADDGTGNNGDQPSGLWLGQDGNSMIKIQIKKHFSFKEKTGKDIFGASVFRRTGSSSSDHVRPRTQLDAQEQWAVSPTGDGSCL